MNDIGKQYMGAGSLRDILHAGVSRYASILSGLLAGFIVPAILSRYFEGPQLSTVLMLSGLATYLVLLDGGISKPIYTSLRRTYIEQGKLDSELNDTNQTFLFLGALTTLVFSTASVSISLLSESNLRELAVFLYGMSFGLVVWTSLYRSIYMAIDRYALFEYLEALKKALLVLTTALLVIDDTFVVSNLAYCATLFGFLIYLSSNSNRMGGILNIRGAYRAFMRVFNRHWKDSRGNFAFTLNELLIYNGGYILFPLFLGEMATIQYALWIKLFFGITMITRGIADVMIHRITRGYFAEDQAAVSRYVLFTSLTSIIAAICLFSLFYFNEEKIFELWMSGEYRLSNLSILGLFIWVLGNSLQHVAGTVLLSIGGYFDTFGKLSFFIMVTILACMMCGILYGSNFGLSLLLSGIAYFFGALIYFGLLLSKARSLGKRRGFINIE